MSSFIDLCRLDGGHIRVALFGLVLACGLHLGGLVAEEVATGDCFFESVLGVGAVHESSLR